LAGRQGRAARWWDSAPEKPGSHRLAGGALTFVVSRMLTCARLGSRAFFSNVTHHGSLFYRPTQQAWSGLDRLLKKPITEGGQPSSPRKLIHTIWSSMMNYFRVCLQHTVSRNRKTLFRFGASSGEVFAPLSVSPRFGPHRLRPHGQKPQVADRLAGRMTSHPGNS